jgi:hypothetical protein
MTDIDLDPVSYLRAMKDGLEELDGKTVRHERVTTVRGGRDRDIEDLTERVAHELGKRIKREGLL